MTASVITPTINPVLTDLSEKHISYYGTLGVAAGDYASGGNTVSFGGIVPHTDLPVRVNVWSETIADGYFFQYVPGTTNSNGTLAVFASLTGGHPNAQLSAGAMPSAIVNDTKLRFKATWVKGR